MNMAAFARRCVTPEKPKGVSRETVRNWKKDGMPVDNEDAAAEWVVARYPQYAKALFGDVGEISAAPPPADGVVLDGLDLHSTLERFRRLEFMAWEDLSAAQELRRVATPGTKTAASLDASITRAAKRFKDASNDRMMMEKKVADFELETGRRIPMEAAKQLLDDALGGLAVILNALPFQEHRNLNPNDPETAQQELKRIVKNILRQMRGEGEADAE